MSEVERFVISILFLIFFILFIAYGIFNFKAGRADVYTELCENNVTFVNEHYIEYCLKYNVKWVVY